MIFDLKIKVVGLTIFECFYKMEHGSEKNTDLADETDFHGFDFR